MFTATEATITVDKKTALIIPSTFFSRDRSSRNWFVTWLTIDGVPAAMIKIGIGGSDYDCAVVCDIEVREGYQGQGLCRKFITELEKVIGEKLYTTGSFTPEGFQALAHFLPIRNNGEAAINTPSMTFVQDWNSRQMKW